MSTASQLRESDQTPRPSRVNPRLSGAGLGLRRSMLSQLTTLPSEIDFFELAPENWIGVGGRLGRQLRQISEQRPIVCHGLSLSVGGTAPLDMELVDAIGHFMDRHDVEIYSEHLSYSNDGGHLYDLLPLPFTEEAVRHAAGRIRQVQDRLGRRIALENVSYYLTPKQDMDEATFVAAVLEEADCDLLLDVNNVYVNSVNHDYDPLAFIERMPAERIAYLHVAGHLVREDGMIIDTHGSDVIDPVWQLLGRVYELMGLRGTLLERDFNLPQPADLLQEVRAILALQEGTHEQIHV